MEGVFDAPTGLSGMVNSVFYLIATEDSTKYQAHILKISNPATINTIPTADLRDWNQSTHLGVQGTGRISTTLTDSLQGQHLS